MLTWSCSSSDYDVINPLECRGDYSATPSNMKLIHWLLVGGVLHLVQREGTGWGHSPPWPLFAVPNVTTHPSMASAPITILQYNGPLLCGFNEPIKGLNWIIYITVQTSFGNSKTSLCTSKKSFAFLVQFLSDIVPYETGHCLKVTSPCYVSEIKKFY